MDHFPLLLIFLLSLLLAPVSQADPTSLTGNSVGGVFGEGATGLGKPDAKTGAMTWSYPFDLPAARGRPQPRLSLNYNSSSNDREAGYGWGLDLPVIERKPLSGNPCFTDDGVPIRCGEPKGSAPIEQRYTYNGQPLVLICEVPESHHTNTFAASGNEEPFVGLERWMALSKLPSVLSVCAKKPGFKAVPGAFQRLF